MINHIKSITLLHEKYPTRNYYPFKLSIFNKTRHLVFDTPVTLFAGENGTGKSTLMEALARGSDIHIWSKPGGTRYQANRYEKQLHNCLSLEWSNGRVPGAFFGSEIFKDFKSILDEWAASDPGQLKYFGGKSLVTQSHGQSMMCYFRSRYQIKGLYLLDEPRDITIPTESIRVTRYYQKK